MKEKKKVAKEFFRFGVISSVKSKLLQGRTLSEAVILVEKEDHWGIEGQIKVKKRTIYRWYSEYEKLGIGGLKNHSRETVISKVLSEKILLFLKEQKEKDPMASIPEIIKIGVLEGIISKGTSRSTVYRACLKMNLPILKGSPHQESNMRRFSYESRMQLVLADGVHFKAGASKKKRVAIFFLDDATRFILHVVVGTSENTKVFLKGVFELIEQYGLFDTLYIDKGPAFKSDATAMVISKIGRTLIHGKTRYPQGHGKIERFNRTARKDILRGLDRPDISSKCSSLQLLLSHYAKEIYNKQKHESLKDTPENKFFNDERELKFPQSMGLLKSYFILKEERKVSNDNIVSMGAINLEVPEGHAGTRVLISQYILNNKFTVFHNAQEVTIHPVDLHQNSVERRGKSKKKTKNKKSGMSPETAAMLSFKKKMPPIVDSDGNCFGKKEQE